MRENLLKGARKLASHPGPDVCDDRPPREGDRGLLGSRHARLADHIEAPEDDLSLEQAERLCAEVTRAWLGDFAPALLLVGAAPRRRLQAALTLTRTCIDFALQPGVEGERMAALNRLQFELEEALDRNPRGQPAYLLIASEEERKPWNREAWDGFFDRVRAVAIRSSLDRARMDSIARAMAEVVDSETGEQRLTNGLAHALSLVLARAEDWRFGKAARPAAVVDLVPVSKPWSRFVGYIYDANQRLDRGTSKDTVGLGILMRLWLLVGARWRN